MTKKQSTYKSLALNELSKKDEVRMFKKPSFRRKLRLLAKKAKKDLKLFNYNFEKTIKGLVKDRKIKKRRNNLFVINAKDKDSKKILKVETQRKIKRIRRIKRKVFPLRVRMMKELLN